MKAVALAGLLLLAQGLAIASHPASTHVEHEAQDNTAGHRWVKGSRVANHVTLPVRIGLTQTNLEHGHDLLMRISDPISKDYGRHYSAEEVVDLFAPSQISADAVRAWLNSSGVPHHRISISDNKQWLQFDALAVELEALLHTEYYHYDHMEDGLRAIACERYHLPKHIQPHIDLIKPGILGTFVHGAEHGQPHSRPIILPDDGNNLSDRQLGPRDVIKTRHSSETHDCAKVVTPACVRKLYNITDTITKVPGNTAGLYQTVFQYYNGTDMDLFFKNFAPEIQQGTRPRTALVDGAPKQKPGIDVRGGTECDLDIQIIFPWVYPDELINFEVYDRYYQSYKHSPVGIFNVFLDAIDGSYCNKTAFGITGNTPKWDGQIPDPHKGGYKGQLQCGVFKPPKVVSFSYISSESILSVPYQRRMCQEFLKLGLQGTSSFFGSGDGGAGQHSCKGSGREIFQLAFPQSCPYITAVGGSRLPSGVPVQPGVERAAKLKFNVRGSRIFTSGGGFANVFPRPAYQYAAVQNYFKHYNPPYAYYKTKYTRGPPANSTGRYNRIGRGVPDVAAIAQNAANIWHGKYHMAYGTSASSPLWAGLISRINNHRLSANKSTLGFLNPSLYHNPDMLNDVIHGDNPTCTKDKKGYNRGFLCAPGWDPVTGLGTPNYGKMLEYYMSLP